ncbi:MAG: hypothetical protein ACE5KE_01020, partial [Methanosarcinales archaeon]
EEFRFLQRVEIEIEPGKKSLVDILASDISGDGNPDVFIIDTNIDGQFDMVLIDLNADEEPDIVGIDGEGKGYISEAWIV